MLPVLRLDYVQDDADAVFVVVAHEALVCIGCICTNNPISLITALGRLMVRNNDASAWCQGQSCGLLLIFVHHAVCVDHS